MVNMPEYGNYLKLGGIINESDYEKATTKAEDINALESRAEQINKLAEMAGLDPHTADIVIKQAENIARFIGIAIGGNDSDLDHRIVLYGLLRSDTREKGAKYHHDAMSDQQIFMEAVRMAGDAESVKKMIEKYPNINFVYTRN